MGTLTSAQALEANKAVCPHPRSLTTLLKPLLGIDGYGDHRRPRRSSVSYGAPAERGQHQFARTHEEEKGPLSIPVWKIYC